MTLLLWLFTHPVLLAVALPLVGWLMQRWLEDHSWRIAINAALARQQCWSRH